MQRVRFVSLWVLITLILVAVLGIVLFRPVPAALIAAESDDETAIQALIAEMASAVLARDKDAYLANVDLADPVFALEHTRWADDWAEQDILTSFELSVADIRVVAPHTVAGDMTMRWTLRDGNMTRTATYPVRFSQGEAGRWLYAGEAWVTVETEHFRVHVLPGLETAAAALADSLPDLYAHATGSLAFEPDTVVEIKLYDTPENLVANILLSLPPIAGWNEPGESLKMLAAPDQIPSNSVLVHELTHYLTFEMAGSTHGNYPWWLMEGVAQKVAEAYWPDGQRTTTLEGVRAWEEGNRLVAWEAISDFETTPTHLWRYVYPQGYAFVAYVTDVYGDDARNEWLTLMAVDNDLADATEIAFGISFDDLDEVFAAWLEAREWEVSAGAGG